MKDLESFSVLLTVVCLVFAVLFQIVRKTILLVASVRALEVAMRRLALEFRLTEERNRRVKREVSVTAASLKDRTTPVFASCAIAAVGGLIGYASGTLSVWTVALLLGIIACPLLDFWLAKFRFEHGYYGNNEREARELIAFILKNSDKFDPGDGNLRIFEPELDGVKTSSAGVPVPSGQVA